VNGNGRTSRLLSTLALYSSGYNFKRLFKARSCHSCPELHRNLRRAAAQTSPFGCFARASAVAMPI